MPYTFLSNAIFFRLSMIFLKKNALKQPKYALFLKKHPKKIKKEPFGMLNERNEICFVKLIYFAFFLIYDFF